MSARTSLALLACGLILAACDRPKGAPASEPTPAATSAVQPVKAPDRPPEPIHWDQASGRFTLDGQVLKTAHLWRFDGGADGFVAAGSRLETVSGGGIRFSGEVLDSVLRSPQNLAIDGRRYNAVLVRLTRQAASEKWDGSLFYTTASHGEANDFHTKPIRGANPVVGETTIMVYDLANPKKGGEDWTTSTISGLRLDLDDSPGGAFVIHQISVVSLPGSALLRPAQ